MDSTKLEYGVSGELWLTTRQAADELCVTRHRVAQLIQAGELIAKRSAGDAFLIDSLSVAKYLGMRQGRGRPFSAPVAWATLFWLSGLTADWLTYSQKRRLRLRLHEIDADELVWILRKRANTVELRVHESLLEEVAELVTLSGVSSNCLSEFNLTDEFGIARRLEGYGSMSVHNEIINKYGGVVATDANVVLHVVKDEQFWHVQLAETPLAVVAADLGSLLSARERTAGREKLGELLDEWRG